MGRWHSVMALESQHKAPFSCESVSRWRLDEVEWDEPLAGRSITSTLGTNHPAQGGNWPTPAQGGKMATKRVNMCVGFHRVIHLPDNNSCCYCCILNTNTTTQPFYGPFPGPPGWAGTRRELLDFMVQGKINRCVLNCIPNSSSFLLYSIFVLSM